MATLTAKDTMSDDNEPSKGRDLSRELLDLLPPSGAPVGNTYLRRRLNVSEHDYWRVRDHLVRQKLVGVGRGRGGSTFRVVEDPAVSIQEDASALGDPQSGVDTLHPVPRTDPGQEGSHELTASAERPTIERITVTNFKRISEASVSLAPITVLVGGNNSGKSSFSASHSHGSELRPGKGDSGSSHNIRV